MRLFFAVSHVQTPALVLFVLRSRSRLEMTPVADLPPLFVPNFKLELGSIPARDPGGA
jgi:hypothetical protein